VKVALVDADIGQSFLGPPTTIGLALFDSPPNWERWKIS
jgi:polynucleotide 5'-kinase involved in rRNA processing